jgi:hypothetical protein
MASPITDGASLVKALKDSGTGETKLAVARALLAERFGQGKTATAAEVVQALTDAGVAEGTVGKATSLMLTGEEQTVATIEIPIEERILKASKPSPSPPPPSPPPPPPPAK